MDLYVLKQNLKYANQMLPRPMRKLCIVQVILVIAFILFVVQVKKVFESKPEDSRHLRLKLLDYFDHASYRGVNVKYFSSANNLSLVNVFLKGDYDVIEGDVTATSSSEVTMYEPPGRGEGRSRRLTLKKWLLAATVRGRAIKIDVKNTECVRRAVAALRSQYSVNPTFRSIPLIVGGNILNGPNWAKAQFTAIDASVLIDSLRGFPTTAVALGWANALDKSSSGANKYDWTCIKEMYDVASRLLSADDDLRLTFNVRVDFAASSVAGLRWLTEMTGGSLSLQLGDDTPTDDAYLSIADFATITSQLSPSKVFYEMNIKTEAFEDDTLFLTTDGEFGMDRWQVIRYHSNGELVYLGTSSLVMQHAVVISRADDVVANINVPVIFEVDVEFIKTFTGPPSYVEFCTRANVGSIAESVSGLCVRLSSTGDMSLLSRAIPGVDIVIESTVHSPRGSSSSPGGTGDHAHSAAREPRCFSVRLVDSGVEIAATTTRYSRCDRGRTSELSEGGGGGGGEIGTGSRGGARGGSSRHRVNAERNKRSGNGGDVLERRKAVVQVGAVTTATGKRALISAGGDNGFVVVERFQMFYQASDER